MQVERKGDLSLRLLEVFGAVMHHRTTTGAAEHLGISQPAVSNAIKSLEKQLGFALFERINRRLVPTEEARLLLAESEPAFEILRSIEAEIRDLRKARAGRLRLSATPPLGHTLVPIALKAFLAERPKVTVRYSVRRLETVVQAVEAGISDIGLVLGIPQGEGLSVQPLSKEQMVCVLPRGHALEACDAVTPDDLARHDLIGLETSLGAIVRTAFFEQGVAYHPRVEVRYCHTACILADAGVGVSVVDPFSALFSRGLDIAIRPFLPTCYAQAVVISRRDAPFSKLTASFVRMLQKTTAQHMRAASG